MSAAALVACGDKVEILPTPDPVVVTPHVTSVTVSGPTTYQLGTISGNQIAYGFTLVADAGYTGARTVTWSSSNTAVATINASTGVATALSAGSTVISATSTQDGVVGQLSLTVQAAPAATPTTPASVVVAAITQGAGGPPGSVLGANVDAGNAGGQLNVNVDVSYTTANRPSTITLDLIGPSPATTVTNCDSRPFGGAGAAADADVSTVTMSCLTAAYDAVTGATRFKNGTYTLRASLGGTATATTPAVTQITINNADFIRINKPSTIAIGSGTTGAHPVASQTPTTGPQAGFVWNSGSVQVNFIPVIYTFGRAAATITASLVNASSAGGGGAADVGALVGPAGGNTIVARSANNAGIEAIACGTAFATFTGAFTGATAVTFGGNDSTTAVGVENVMVDTVIAVAAVNDAQGNALTLMRAGDAAGTVYTAPTAATCAAAGATTTAAVTAQSFIRLDNRDPGRSNFDPRDVLQGATNEAPSNSAWIGTGVTFPTAVVAGNGLTLGVDSGANANTVSYQYAAAGTAQNAATGWTTVTAPSGIPNSSNTAAYNLRIITRDVLFNADTSFVTGLGGALLSANTTAAQATPSTIGVDLVTPTVTVGGTTNAGSIISSLACTYLRGTVCARTTLPTPAPAFAVSDAAASNGASGSGFSTTPLLVSIRRVTAHPTVAGVGDQTVWCHRPADAFFAAEDSVQVLATSANFNCTVPTAGAAYGLTPTSTTITFPVATQGDYLLTYQVVDQANNRSSATSATIRYYIDNTAPAVAGNPMQIPASIVGGTTFQTTGLALSDNMDLAGASAVLNYPLVGLRLLAAGTLNGTTTNGAALDQQLFRRADATYTLPTPFPTDLHLIAGGAITAGGTSGKPDNLGLRAFDRGLNLSAVTNQALPATNITGNGMVGAAGQPYIIGTDLNDFSISSISPNTAGSGGSTVGSTSTTITARVTAPSGVTGSPFTQVCFYWAAPANTGTDGAGSNATTVAAAGDLIFIGCQPTPTVTQGPAPTFSRFFDYAQAFTQPTVFNAGGTFTATGGSAQFPIRAIGFNAAGQALVTAAVNYK